MDGCIQGNSTRKKRGLDDVLEAREKEAFRDASPRFAYKTFIGVKAPTFCIEEINKGHSLGLQLDKP
jgi:hypothetical protein